MRRAINLNPKPDQYGNIIYRFTREYQPTIDDLFGIAKKHDKKGVVLKNLNQNIVNNFNRVSDEEIKYQGHDTDNLCVHVLRNGSSCPTVFNGKTYASKVSSIIFKNNNYYSLMVKDKKKNIGAIGGVCEIDEYKMYNKTKNYYDFILSIAERELEEETQGSVYIDGKIEDVPSITYDKLELLGTIKFNNSIYGIDVDDTCNVFRLFLEYDSDNIFINKLFSESNKDKYGNYTLKYHENSETQYIHALKFTEHPNILTVNNFKGFFSQADNINLDPKVYATGIIPRVNNINRFYDLIHYGYLNSNIENDNPVTIDNKQFNGFNLITHINSITVYPFKQK